MTEETKETEFKYDTKECDCPESDGTALSACEDSWGEAVCEQCDAVASEHQEDFITKVCKVLSFVLHPFVMPTIGVAILFYSNTVMAMLTPFAKLYTVFVVFVNTLVVPAVGILILYKTGILRNLSLSSRRERYLPIAIVAAGYLSAATILNYYYVIHVMLGMFIGTFVSLLGCFLINLRWKISLHMTAIGGVTGLMCGINYSVYGNVPVAVLGMIILSGVLASARLYLGKHNLWQVVAGFSLGFLVMLLCIIL